jgi:hypothetical protein
MKPIEERHHLAEVSELLALGLMRLQARKSSPKSADRGEVSLHSSPVESGHAAPGNEEPEP